MKNDYEYRYFMDNDKLMRFHLEQEEYFENPRDMFGSDSYFTKMYMSSRDYTCTDDKIAKVKSNKDAIRMMIRNADIDVVGAVIEGRIPRMEIKYDDECEYYELYVDDGIEASNDCYEWLEDDIIECLTIDDLEKISDDLYVIALGFGYEGCIKALINQNICCGVDGFIWTTTNDMIKAGFKNMSSEDLRKRAYEILEADIDTENLWATGNVFWYQIEECTNVTDCENEANWVENDSCGGFIVDGWKAYDEIYDDVIGNSTPYYDDLDDLYDWPEFKVSFDDYFEILSEADTSEDIDGLREELRSKLDWSAKSLADYITEVSESVAGLRLRLDNIVNGVNYSLDSFSGDCIYKPFDRMTIEYHKTYENYIDLDYRLKELKSIEKAQAVYESEVA